MTGDGFYATRNSFSATLSVELMDISVMLSGTHNTCTLSLCFSIGLGLGRSSYGTFGDYWNEYLPGQSQHGVKVLKVKHQSGVHHNQQWTANNLHVQKCYFAVCSIWIELSILKR